MRRATCAVADGRSRRPGCLAAPCPATRGHRAMRPRLWIAASHVALVAVLLVAVTWSGPAWSQSFSLDLGQGGQAGTTSRLIQLTVAMGVLSLAPSLLVMMTAFTRIVIVLSLLR